MWLFFKDEKIDFIFVFLFIVIYICNLGLFVMMFCMIRIGLEIVKLGFGIFIFFENY